MRPSTSYVELTRKQKSVSPFLVITFILFIFCGNDIIYVAPNHNIYCFSLFSKTETCNPSYGAVWHCKIKTEPRSYQDPFDEFNESHQQDPQDESKSDNQKLGKWSMQMIIVLLVYTSSV